MEEDEFYSQAPATISKPVSIIIHNIIDRIVLTWSFKIAKTVAWWFIVLWLVETTDIM